MGRPLVCGDRRWVHQLLSDAAAHFAERLKWA
jgi:hypothetical protein